jgi:hypothetical protein
MGVKAISTRIRPLSIHSAPALAAALRTMDRDFFAPVDGFARPDRLAPMYHIPSHGVEEEGTAAAHVVSQIAERLRRLTAAYGEWERFDAPAYFDLSCEQTAALVKIVERVSTVHVVCFCDLLLPTFRNAATFWSERFTPAFIEMRQEPLLAEQVYTELQPVMVERWERLVEVIRSARTILAEDVGFLATNGAQDERDRWQRWWADSARPGLDALLTPPLAQVPTLTLTIDFALPVHRQPGRLRRLRANRDRRRRGRSQR